MISLKHTYPIGIDITDRDVYAAQVQETREGISVRELFHRDLGHGPGEDSGTGDSLIPILKAIAGNKRFRGKTVTLHLPARHIYAFPISFEPGVDETLEEGMVRECRKHLPFPLEEAVIDYPSINDISSGKAKKFKAIVIAARRSHIEQYIQLLKQAGLRVAAIEFDLSSLLRLHRHLFSINDGPLILCNIGQEQSLIAIVTGDGILAQRNASWGTKQLLSRLEHNLELSGKAGQALEMLNHYGLYYDHQISLDKEGTGRDMGDKEDAMGIYRTVFQILSPHIDGLIHEFYQITGYVRSETQKVKFEQAYIYGQASSINFLDQYLEKKLNIPTKCINPMTVLGRSDRDRLPDRTGGAPFAVALGLAMRREK